MRFPSVQAIRRWRSISFPGEDGLAFRIVCCLVLLAGQGVAEENGSVPERNHHYTLDREHRTVVQPVDSKVAESGTLNFLRIQIFEIVNPKKIPVRFELHYQPEHGKKTFLGTFSPLPPDNPTRFIVATRGLIRTKGAIALSMILPDEVDPGIELQIKVRPFSLQSDTSYPLDARYRSVIQPVGPDLDKPNKQKFVQIEIADVFNPKKDPLSFEVHYQFEDGRKVFLGTFSLFPPDNPGEFIVATQGRLRNEGTLVLSLVFPNGLDPHAELQVKVRRISFKKG